jgi:hypothetical protein
MEDNFELFPSDEGQGSPQGLALSPEFLQSTGDLSLYFTVVTTLASQRPTL